MKTYIFTVIGLCLALSGIPQFAHAESSDMKTAGILKEVNEYRDEKELAEVKMDNRLQSAATAKLRDMEKQQYWAHYGPGGESPWQFIKAEDYSYSIAGENLAISYIDEAELVDAWIASPEHDKVLRGDYTHAGISQAEVSIGERNGILVVAMFAEPKNAVIQTVEETTTEILSFVRRVVFTQPTRMLSRLTF